MSLVINLLVKLGILKEGLDYHLARTSMVIVFLFFGYSKWFDYEAQGLISYISHGPLISWMYPVFGIRGASRFLGVSEWSFAVLLFAGFWNKKLGILGAIGSCFAFFSTLTIIPFLPNAWAASAGGFPAMTDSVAFLMKDLALFAVSVYLLRQDVRRVSQSARESSQAVAAQLQHNLSMLPNYQEHFNRGLRKSKAILHMRLSLKRQGEIVLTSPLQRARKTCN